MLITRPREGEQSKGQVGHRAFVGCAGEVTPVLAQSASREARVHTFARRGEEVIDPLLARRR